MDVEERRQRPRPAGLSVGTKLVLAFSFFIIVLIGLHLLFIESRDLMQQQKHLEASRLARMVSSIISKEMVEHEPWRVQEHMSLAAGTEHVDNIRIVDRSSHVRYGLRDQEIDIHLDPHEHEQCRQCHSVPAAERPDGLMWTNAQGERVFSFHYSLQDEDSCYECHEQGSPHMGKILVDLLITEPDLAALSMNRRLATSGTVLVLFTILGMTLIIRTFVTRPIRRLVGATRELQRGNFEPEYPPVSNDEIGELNLAFQEMAGRVGSLVIEQEDEIARRTEELRLNQQQMIHQEKMAALGRMTAGVAHEVGNPLASISAMVQLLERSSGEESTRERAKELGVHVQRISRIVRELGNLYRPGSDRVQRVDIERTIASVIDMARYDRGFKQIEIEARVDPECPELWLVEDVALQVLLNLIFNAVDAMPEGGRLSIAAAPRDAGVEITVTDDGDGIAPDDLAKIFDPFFTTKPAGKGSGLGLWMSHSLVERMGGTLRIESEPGKGTTARLWMPGTRKESGDVHAHSHRR